MTCSRYMQAEILVMDEEELEGRITDGERDYASMPFELRALEVALDIVRCPPPRTPCWLMSLANRMYVKIPVLTWPHAGLGQACQHVEQQATTLEASATPLLQTTTASKVGHSGVLPERVRHASSAETSLRPVFPGDQRLPGAAAADEGTHERAEDQGGDGVHILTPLLSARSTCSCWSSVRIVSHRALTPFLRGQCWQMKEVLEKFLEDEDDMLDMNLTARLVHVPRLVSRLPIC